MLAPGGSATIAARMGPATGKGTLAQDLRALLRSPRELWLLYLATFFEWLGIFSFLPTLPLWLTGDFGMDDKAAGWWAATFATVMTGLIFVVGSLADRFGIRATLIAAFCVAAVTRLGMSLAGTPGSAITWLMLFALAYATISPVIQAAIQRASNARTRAFAFSFWYVSFNLSGTLSGPLVIDLVRRAFLDPSSGQLVRRTVALPILGERSMSAAIQRGSAENGWNDAGSTCSLQETIGLAITAKSAQPRRRRPASARRTSRIVATRSIAIM